jgi:hypothetical protein
MTWKTGQSGNPRGRLSEKLFADAVRMAVNEEEPTRKVRKLRLIADKLVEQAMAGEGWAIQQVADRLDGKPAQEATITHRHDVAELTDNEIAERIAELRGAGTSGGVSAPPIDPSKLN